MATLWVQLSIIEDTVVPGHKDDGHHVEPGQDFTQVPLEVQRGYVGHILSQICMYTSSNGATSL